MAADDLRCVHCLMAECTCEEVGFDLDDEYGPSYLVESYDVWDLVGGTAW